MIINNYLEYKSFLTKHELKHAPKDLDLQGNFSLMYKGKRILIVGSGKGSPESSLRILVIIRKLVKKEIIIVSDLTEDIDSIAHKSAIIEKGKTIVITDLNANQDYTNTSKSLLEPIKNELLMVTPFSLNYPLKLLNYEITNYTTALISDAIIIAEAFEESYIKHLVWEALRLGRSVLILESVINNNTVSWIKKIKHYGAQILHMKNFDATIDNIPYLTAKSGFDF